MRADKKNNKTQVLQVNDTIILGCRCYVADWHSKVCNELRTNETNNLKKKQTAFSQKLLV